MTAVDLQERGAEGESSRAPTHCAANERANALYAALHRLVGNARVVELRTKRDEAVPLIERERVRLRVGPEVQWIAQVGQELMDRDVATHGLAVGGAAALELVLGRRWTVAATYRELRAFFLAR